MGKFNVIARLAGAVMVLAVSQGFHRSRQYRVTAARSA
jgi:hypothetical protein